MSAATSEITLPLGTSPHGTPVSWHLTDQAGRPQHGQTVPVHVTTPDHT